jgi:hypothetical protein
MDHALSSGLTLSKSGSINTDIFWKNFIIKQSIAIEYEN